MPADSGQPSFKWVSERHLRIEIGPDSVAGMHDRIGASLHAIQHAALPGLRDITPAGATLLLEFDENQIDEQLVHSAVQRVLVDVAAVQSSLTSTSVEIPVCYDSSCAPDAAGVARIHGITPDELIRLHAGAEYIVQFIGFVPGFGYLSGLPDRLNTPRLDTPRTRVPAGSVGIAADQTGVYPGNTAGGWRLIGRTPLRMFDPGREKPSLLRRGDRVRFVPITLSEFSERMREPGCNG